MVNSISNFIADVIKTVLGFLRGVLVFIASVVVIFVILAVIGSWLSKPEARSGIVVPKETVIHDEGGKDKIVYAKLMGEIVADDGTPSILTGSTSTITASSVRTLLLQVKQDPLAKAIIFDINSPGGSPVASDRIFELIRDFKKQTNKPVIFLMSDMAASGGYYISSSADYIVANPATLTGSIGVILESYNLQELYKKIGVSKQTFKQGIYKDMLSENRPVTAEEQKIIDSLDENTYNLFISRVAEGRKLPIEQVRGLATGQIYSGREAKDLQLVDSLGNIDEAIYQAKSLANLSSFQVVEYQSSSFWNTLLSQASASFSPAKILAQFLYQPSTILRQQ